MAEGFDYTVGQVKKCSLIDINFTGLSHLLESPGIFIGKFPEPGKSLNLLGNDVDGK